jgi:hypothetical protein
LSAGEEEDLRRGLDAFKKCGNIEMCQSIGLRLGFSGEQ